MIGSATGNKGVNVREVSAEVFVDKLAHHLENNKLITAPKWADLVKSGCLAQMPPNYQNWWYIRAASIARQVYLHPGTSVEALRNRYGGDQNNGVAPKHHRKSGGKIIRTILQQLEKMGWVEKNDENGRRITKKGQKQLDLIAKGIAK